MRLDIEFTFACHSTQVPGVLLTRGVLCVQGKGGGSIECDGVKVERFSPALVVEGRGDEAHLFWPLAKRLSHLREWAGDLVNERVSE